MDEFITLFQTFTQPTLMSCCDFESNGVCNLSSNGAALVVCACECSLCRVSLSHLVIALISFVLVGGCSPEV